jgi:hypothetical protein
VLGEEHPDTAQGLNNLAILCFHEGDFKEAALLMKRALAIDEKVFGKNHPRTKSARKNLEHIKRQKKR